MTNSAQKYFYAILFICVLQLSAQADKLADSWLAANTVEAPSYFLMDLDSERILAQKNMHAKRYPASTTKIMTALLAIESGKMDQPFTIGPNPPKTGESSMFLEQGEVFTLRQLVQALLVKSANDSAVAIAEAVSGSEPKFVELMNLKAKQLGCKDTHFTNPHGLHNENHYTTAYDLSLIARAAMKYPFFRETVALKSVSLHGNDYIPQRTFYNSNRLLQHWEKCDGVKTGYTREAGRCLVATATEEDPVANRKWQLLSVVMHAPNSWSDSINLLQHQGFEQYHLERVVDAGEKKAQIPIQKGKNDAVAVAKKDLWLPLQNNKSNQLETRVQPLKRTAPVKKGEIVAYITWNDNDHQLAAIPLIAQADVERAWKYDALDFMNGNGAIYQSKWVWLGLILMAIFTTVRINTSKRRREQRLARMRHRKR